MKEYFIKFCSNTDKINFSKEISYLKSRDSKQLKRDMLTGKTKASLSGKEPSSLVIRTVAVIKASEMSKQNGGSWKYFKKSLQYYLNTVKFLFKKKTHCCIKRKYQLISGFKRHN